MPDFSEPAAGAERRDTRRNGRHANGGARRRSNVRTLHLWISVLPAVVVGLLGLTAVMVLYTGGAERGVTGRTQLILVLVAAGVLITLGAAAFAAEEATRRVHREHDRLSARVHEGVQQRLGDLWYLIVHGRQGLRELAERLKAGAPAPPRGEEQPITDTGDPFTRLAQELRRSQTDAWNAVIDTANRASDTANRVPDTANKAPDQQAPDQQAPAPQAPDQRVGVFVNLARRMQSLTHRAIQGLDELENQVEDPDLLKGLFRVDHLCTRMRRQAESLAVIGGASSRRQWSRPVTVYEVLRSAIAEVEHYNRVKVVAPADGTLDGSAVADVIHLLAELIENATRFAPPHTQVLIRVDHVTAGLAIEVEDRGLGIPREDRRRLNALLADPDRTDASELLQDGRIGLLVVAALARRHNVRVQLQDNVYGGTQAVVVVAKELVSAEAEETEAQPQAVAQPAPQAVASTPAAVAATPPPSASLSGTRQDIDTGPIPAHGGRAGAAPPADARPPAATGPEPGPQAGTGTPGPALSFREGAVERPALPRRRAQASLAPELVDPPAPQRHDQEVGHNPGLMAAFQRGVRGGRESGGAADAAESAD